MGIGEPKIWNFDMRRLDLVINNEFCAQVAAITPHGLEPKPCTYFAMLL